MKNEHKEALEKAIRENWEEEVRTLSQFLSINSVETEPQTKTGAEGSAGETFPFGEGPHQALLLALNTGKELGFDVVNADNFGGHIEFPGASFNEEGEMVATAEETMGIAGHLDVVPAGDGWEHEPFALSYRAEDGTESTGEDVIAAARYESEGTFFGRGVLDDKGPVVASLFAMKAIAHAGLVPHTNVRLILGLDEETNSRGMEEYLKREGEPDFGFTPDSEFPIVHGEKGILVFDMVKKLGAPAADGLALRSFTGGEAANMVAGSARVIVLSKDKSLYEPIRDKAARWKDEGRADIATKMVGKSLEITLQGKSAHGSTPEKGINAVTKMVSFLSDVNFNCDEVNEFIQFYDRCIGEETDGTSLGCAFSDEPSGKLVLNVGKILVDQKTATLTVNIRYPVTMAGEQIYDALRPCMDKYDIGVVKGRDVPPIYKSPEDPLVSTLLEVYREETGDRETRPHVSGGGTYAREFKNILAFGALFPGREDCMHRAEEHLQLADLRDMTKIFAMAIYKLAVE